MDNVIHTLELLRLLLLSLIPVVIAHRLRSAARG